MSQPSTPWCANAVFYALDVGLYADGDGVGDFASVIGRLDHLASLGVDCDWLLPFYPSPNRDNGDGVADHRPVDPRHGTLADFDCFVSEAGRRGLRLVIDLVARRTSDKHPWVHAAREDPKPPYRHHCVWTDDPSKDARVRPSFASMVQSP